MFYTPAACSSIPSKTIAAQAPYPVEGDIFMKTLALTVVLTLWGASAPAQAQSANRSGAAGLGKADASSNVDANIRAYIELLRTDIKGAKSQVMAEVMQLDADQATKFWPVYKDFEGEFTALGDQVLKLIREY